MILDWLRRRRRGPVELSHLHFVIYTRQGCHLCDDAWERLQEWQKRYHFTLDTVDVDTDAGLRAQYGEQVPVVTVNGKVRFRGCVNRVLLQRLLEAEAFKSPPRPQ